MRDSLLLTSLFVIAACPPSAGTTSETGTTDSPTASTGGSGTGTTDGPTTSGTTDSPTGTTSDTTSDTTSGTTSDTTSGTTSDTTSDTTSGTTGEPLIAETCADVLAGDPGAADGEYTLYVGEDPLKPWLAYCHDMATEPKEYLVLVNVEAGHNFSQYTASDPRYTDVVTTFTRVRLDPITLIVDIDDLTFSNSTGMVIHGGPVTSMPYAVAEGCASPNLADGVGNVDLVGTPFKVIDPFCTKGAEATGDVVFSENDQVVDLTGGGYCGWTGPTKGDMCVSDPQNKSSGFVLELEYLGA